MVDDRASPSAGWQAVCDEMDVDTGIEEPTRRCPTCNRSCENLLADAYECEEHGVFRASASDDISGREGQAESNADGFDEESSADGFDEESSADDFDEVEHHARGQAD